MENANIVIVEDEYIVALDIKMHLQRFGYRVPALFASGEDLLERIEAVDPDLVLMDIKLQGRLDGLETAKIVWEKHGVPVVMLTAFSDEASLERAKTVFPFGYVIKPFEERELRATIVLALYKHEMENRLRERERLFSATFSSIPDAVFVFDSADCLDYMNPAAEKMTGRSFSAAWGETRDALIRLDEMDSGEMRARHPGVSRFDGDGGSDILVEQIVSPLTGVGNNTAGTVIVLRDVTERVATDRILREREEQLRQVQKMEAVGRLAGGIAHDFNNFLTIIMGFSKMIMEECGQDPAVRSNVEGIQQAAMRSAILTRQLLMFSRNQRMEPRPVNLNRLVADMEKMMIRLLSEGSSIIFSLDARRPDINVDAGQVEQVLMNLIINARDAMTAGGSVLVQTRNQRVTGSFATVTGVIPEGEYVALSVRDSGYGIAPEIVPQIFDPFFTTKEKGKGTGLGLATVYGIVKQSGGYITVHSEPGRETTFTLYFPLHEPAGSEEPARKEEPAGCGGNETILIVEDEAYVRTLIVRILTKLGYHVVDTQNAGEALLICEEYPTRIDLLITDMILPHVNGSVLAKRLLALRPDLKVLFLSGLSSKALQERNLLSPGDEFLQKPFDVEEFSLKVRTLLDA